MENELEMTFGALLRMMIDGRNPDRAKLPNSVAFGGDGIGTLRLPTMGEQAAISSTELDITPSIGPIDWLQSSGVPLMDMIRTVLTPAKKGVLPVGGDLPTAGFTGEFENLDESDPSIMGHAFDKQVFAEASTSVTSQAVIQSADDLLGAIQEALRIAIAEKLLEQLMTGGGGSGAMATATLGPGGQGAVPADSVASIAVRASGSDYPVAPTVTIIGDGAGAEAEAVVMDGAVSAINVTEGGSGYTSVPRVVLESIHVPGILELSGAQMGTYRQADIGNVDTFLTAEEAIEDAAGTPLAWVMGRSLASEARRTSVDPGSGRFSMEAASSRRVVENANGQIVTTGTPVFKDGSLAGTTGICADWRRAVALVLDTEIEFTINAVSKPGTVKITARLAVDFLALRPELIYVLTQSA